MKMLLYDIAHYRYTVYIYKTTITVQLCVCMFSFLYCLLYQNTMCMCVWYINLSLFKRGWYRFPSNIRIKEEKKVMICSLYLQQHHFIPLLFALVLLSLFLLGILYISLLLQYPSTLFFFLFSLIFCKHTTLFLSLFLSPQGTREKKKKTSSQYNVHHVRYLDIAHCRYICTQYCCSFH